MGPNLVGLNAGAPNTGVAAAAGLAPNTGAAAGAAPNTGAAAGEAPTLNAVIGWWWARLVRVEVVVAAGNGSIGV